MNVVDDFTRESLAMKAGFLVGSGNVIRTFEKIAFERGLPTTIRFDNGSEFTSRKMLAWGAGRGVLLHFIEPGRPTQNANVELFNGRVRDEFLNTRVFTSIFDAHAANAQWRVDYNECRPHSSLGYLHPKGVRRAPRIQSTLHLSAT